MAGTINNNTSYDSFKSILSGGGNIIFETGTNKQYSPGTHAEIEIGANAIITGNNATISVQEDNDTNALNSSKPWLNIHVNNGVTINNLNLKGRCNFEIRGSNITFNNCIVDQSSPYASKYNALDGLYACFLISNTGAHHITYNNCNALYADHMGFAVWNGGGTFNCYEIKYLYTNAKHCGSGRENNGENPWGRGFDFLEDLGTVKFYAYKCCAYDCLQSGYYNEGSYDGHKPHSIEGTLEECHAEQCGMRIVNAAINNTNLIAGIPWPNGQKSSSPDVYGDGYYCLGSGVTIKNCTSKNNLIGFSTEDATVDGFQDEGSYIGGQTSGGKVANATFVKPKYHALVWWNTLRGNSTIRIIDPPSGRAPVLASWVAMQGQRCIHPNSYNKISTDHNNLLSTKYNGNRYITLRELKERYWNGFSGSTSGLQITVNDNNYSNINTCVKSHTGGSCSTSNISVSVNTGLTYIPVTGCGGSVITPVTCTPGEIDCANKKKCIGDSIANAVWQDADPSDPTFIQRCGGSTTPGTTETLKPYGSTPALKKDVDIQIYARDFALGGQDVAFNETTPQNDGDSDYRTDGGSISVDLVDWGKHTGMNEPDTNKVVIAYTREGEWLKYPVNVVDNGTYTFTFRASTTESGCEIHVSVDDGKKTIIDLLPTVGYNTFTSCSANVVVPYIRNGAIIKVAFKGDMNILWFKCRWVNATGATTLPDDPDTPVNPPIEELNQLPYNNFVVRNEYGYNCRILGQWYDTGGEGKAYHNVAVGDEHTYRRGIDTIELLDECVDTSTDEWLEYTINISSTAYYYFKLRTKNNDPNAKIHIGIVDSEGKELSKIFEIPIPVTGDQYTEFYAKENNILKYLLTASESTTLRVTFTGHYLFHNMTIVPSDTVEGKIASTSFFTTVPDISTLPVIIKAWQFDNGGPGISYMDKTEERFGRKEVRDSDVDIITVGRTLNGNMSQDTLVSGTMKGEWMQYTINNTTTNEYTDVTVSIDCSTTLPLSKMQIVFINELNSKTYAGMGTYNNTYMIAPPLVSSFTDTQTLDLTVRIYKGKNIMRIYFDDNITLGTLTFSS